MQEQEKEQQQPVAVDVGGEAVPSEQLLLLLGHANFPFHALQLQVMVQEEERGEEAVLQSTERGLLPREKGGWVVSGQSSRAQWQAGAGAEGCVGVLD